MDQPNRVFTVFAQVALAGRPGTQVAEHVSDGPLGRHLEFRRRQLVPGERDPRVACFDQAPFGRPERLQDVCVQPAHNGIALLRDLAQLVAPRCDDTARDEHARRLGKEAPRVEPVQRLADRDQVRGGILQPRILGRGDAVADTGMCNRRVDLCPARIRGDHALEMIGKSNGCLPVAGCTIPGEPAARKAGEIGEQLARIKRPVPRVARGLSREMVFEVRPCRHYMLQDGDFPACFASL